MTKHLLTSAAAVLAASASLFTIAGCASKPKPEPTGIANPLPVQSFKRDWSSNLELGKGDGIDRVFLREDAVIAYSKSKAAYVLNKGSGLIRFTSQITDSIVPPHEPVVLKDKIVFPTDSTLEIYRRDGRFERSYKTSSSLRTNAVGWPGGTRVFFGVDTPGAGRIVCIDTAPGAYKPVNQKWELMSNTGAGIDSAPATVGGVVYVGYGDGWVYAVNADNRQPIWSVSTGTIFKTYGPIQADLRVDDFGVYVPSTDTNLYCLDKTQGRIKWKYHAGTSLRVSPEVTATMVYLPVDGKGIIAIDKLNGPPDREPKWTVRDCVKLVSEDEKYAYFQRTDNMVVAIDKATGEQRFTSKRNDLVTFATNTKDATIYAGTKGGEVLAFTPVLKPGFVGEIALENPRPATGMLAMK